MKKAQVTIFIVIGIVILVSLALIFIVAKIITLENIKTQEAKRQIPSQLVPVVSYVESCLKDTADKALTISGIQGGNLNFKPNTYLSLPDFNLTYYSKELKLSAPPLTKIENELSMYINDNKNSCLTNLNNFSEKEITIKKSSVKTAIKENQVDFLLKMPITIIKDSQEYSFDEFIYTSIVRYGKVYNLATDIAKVPCIQYLPLQDQDIKISYQFYQDKNIFILDDENYNNFTLAFAVESC